MAEVVGELFSSYWVRSKHAFYYAAYNFFFFPSLFTRANKVVSIYNRHGEHKSDVVIVLPG